MSNLWGSVQFERAFLCLTFNVSTILVVLMPIPILSKNHCVYDINDYANANSLEERSGVMAHNNAIS